MDIDGCEKVVVIWDLRPPWLEIRVDKIRPCPIQDCLRIQAALSDAQFAHQQRDQIRLTCIVQELETFLLLDENAIGDYLSSLTGRSCTVPHLRNPERELNPKKRLYKLFQENDCKPYNDMIDAEKIVKLIDIEKLKRSKTFTRFREAILSL